MVKAYRTKSKRAERALYFFSKKVGKALFDYKMLKQGDRILVAVSGGKDSLSLLRVMQYRQSFSPIKYELLAVHVDTFGGAQTPPFRAGKDCAALSINPEQTTVFRPWCRRIDLGYKGIDISLLEEYFRATGVDYKIIKGDFPKQDKTHRDGGCFWCSWNRRKALFEAAEKFGCSKVALGHHKDDIVETILLNMFFNGEISGMNPAQELFKGALTIIRPLAYVEEKEIIRLTKALGFPVQRCSCPHSGNTMRDVAAKVIKSVERHCPEIRTNIFRSLKRVKEDYIL